MFRQTILTLWRPLLMVGMLMIGVVSTILLYSNVLILSYREQPVTSTDITTSSIAIIFGGGMEADGTQTIMQKDRVATGVTLHLNHRADRLLVTGDDGRNRFDEVSAMFDQAVEYGVPETDIVIDAHGYRTYESCWRAAHVFDVTNAIVVSHEFHLPRIRYICESFGIETIGVLADRRIYDDWWVSGPREILARFKAWWQVEITKPFPKVTY